jgi:hypothetical protein
VSEIRISAGGTDTRHSGCERMSSSYPTTHPDLLAQAWQDTAKLTVPVRVVDEGAFRLSGKNAAVRIVEGLAA